MASSDEEKELVKDLREEVDMVILDESTSRDEDWYWKTRLIV